ncbi:MAG: metal ABC transporter permease [Burkholderia sp.]|nr:metal ABC transporter permease [Burkholderia sp.]
MFKYEFMINAFIASAIVSVLAGIVGYFLVLREQTFAGHALSHVGFTGATGAALFGISPIWGMVTFTLLAGIEIGILGEKFTGRDVAIGLILSISLGIGLLFLHFHMSFATQIATLLFGNILAVSRETLSILAIISAVSTIALAAIARPLLFVSLQPEVAEAKGISLRVTSIIFLSICALAVTASAHIVGILLVFTLLVGPAAAAQNITKIISTGITFSALLALGEAWTGITLAYYTDWPTSFWISILSGIAYGLSLNRNLN